MTQLRAKQTPGKIIRDAIILALGVMLASITSSGIHYDDTSTLILVSAVLILFNLVLKPLLIFFALPLVVFTFGLGIWLINALILFLTSEWIDGFTVATFPTALWGAFVISATSILINLFLNPNFRVTVNAQRNRTQNTTKSSQPSKPKDNDVIDI